jgi:DmsE family decaheme c-type cytochrome
MRIKSVLASACIGLFGLFGSAHAAMDAGASAQCLKCHEEQRDNMMRSAHSIAADARTPTCVSCHGASAAHLAKPTDVKPDRMFSGKLALSSSDASEVCLTCHQKDAKRALWAGSAHPAADVSCGGCHKIHTDRDKVLAKAMQSEVCFTCHKEQRALMNRPSRHPLAEGKMSCADCHNVHGSAGPKLAKRDSTNDTCYTCHAEKRGPFVHNHEPVQEDCAICHNPHGSSIAAMLKARAPILCQQCHTPHVAGGVGALGGQPGVFPPAVPGQANSEINATSSGKNVVNIWQGRGCTNCHTQVHGSNNPSATNPTPQLMFR